MGADTIVVGNRGTRGSWWRVKDSVPNLVLRHSPCSVLHRRHAAGAVTQSSMCSTQAARQSGAGNGSAQYAVSFAIFPSRISKMNTAW